MNMRQELCTTTVRRRRSTVATPTPVPTGEGGRDYKVKLTYVDHWGRHKDFDWICILCFACCCYDAAAMMLLPLSHGVNGFRCSPTRNCTLDSTTMDAPLDSRNACLRICSQTVSVPGIELHLHWVLFDRH